MLITVAMQSKAWTIFARLNTGIVGSNPTWCMDVCVCLFHVLARVGSGLVMGWFPAQEVLPTVYRIRKLKSGQRPKGSRAIQRGLWEWSVVIILLCWTLPIVIGVFKLCRVIRTMARMGVRERSVSWNLQNWVKCDEAMEVSDQVSDRTTYGQNNSRVIQEIPAEWLPMHCKMNRPAGAISRDWWITLYSVLEADLLLSSGVKKVKWSYSVGPVRQS
jgi:hypothetical protein